MLDLNFILISKLGILLVFVVPKSNNILSVKEN